MADMPTLKYTIIRKVSPDEDSVGRLNINGMNQKTVLKPRRELALANDSIMSEIIKERAQMKISAWKPRWEFTLAEFFKMTALIQETPSR